MRETARDICVCVCVTRIVLFSVLRLLCGSGEHIVSLCNRSILSEQRVIMMRCRIMVIVSAWNMYFRDEDGPRREMDPARHTTLQQQQ